MDFLASGTIARRRVDVQPAESEWHSSWAECRPYVRPQSESPSGRSPATEDAAARKIVGESRFPGPPELPPRGPPVLSGSIRSPPPAAATPPPRADPALTSGRIGLRPRGPVPTRLRPSASRYPTGTSAADVRRGAPLPAPPPPDRAATASLTRPPSRPITRRVRALFRWQKMILTPPVALLGSRCSSPAPAPDASRPSRSPPVASRARAVPRGRLAVVLHHSNPFPPCEARSRARRGRALTAPLFQGRTAREETS